MYQIRSPKKGANNSKSRHWFYAKLLAHRFWELEFEIGILSVHFKSYANKKHLSSKIHRFYHT